MSFVNTQVAILNYLATNNPLFDLINLLILYIETILRSTDSSYIMLLCLSDGLTRLYWGKYTKHRHRSGRFLWLCFFIPPVCVRMWWHLCDLWQRSLLFLAWHGFDYRVCFWCGRTVMCLCSEFWEMEHNLKKCVLKVHSAIFLEDILIRGERPFCIFIKDNTISYCVC